MRVSGKLISILILATTLPVFAQRVPYVSTPDNVVDRMLKLVHVSSKDKIYDLGCGDGRIVIAAAKQYGTTGVGIDIDPNRIAEADANARKAGVTDKVTFITRDVFASKFSDATVVYLYMLPAFNIRLRPRLLSELKPGTRIAAYTFGLGDWKPDVTESTGMSDYNIYVWIVPANVGGVWDCELKTPRGLRKAVLRLYQQYQQVTGSVIVEDAIYPMSDTKLVGDKLSFSLPLPGAAMPTKFTLNMSNSHPTTKPAPK
ncbi:MAG TPA: class I SAM-dependent methyltransferase [Tepidisphaeraceae bacterium]|jgi:SAM-dependent methyltransferase